jgi:hypothetical protein
MRIFPAFLLLLFVNLNHLHSFSGKCSGTSEDPYQITTLQELNEIRDGLDAHYILMNDIDASETENWDSGAGFEPIGTITHKTSLDGFTGSFNGQNNTISGLYINRPDEDYVGFFGCIADAGFVYNINLDNAHVTGNNDVGIFVGTIYAYNEGSEVSIMGCSANGTATGKIHTGGFCGHNYTFHGKSIISECYALGQVTGIYLICVGGFCGRNSAINGKAFVTGCYAKGNVSGYNKIGGFCGYNFASSGTAIISGCYATGNVIGDSQVGGFCGQNTADSGSASISGCYATGSVTGYQWVGGFSGVNYTIAGTVEISGCYSSGNASGYKQIGGFCGENFAKFGTASINDCFARGNTSGVYEVGGFCGAIYAYEQFEKALIERCYSTGITEGNNFIGGFCGYKSINIESEINDSYWDKETSGYSDSFGGAPKTTAEMKTKSTFVGWDFENIWGIDPDINDGYPFLRAFYPDYNPDSHVEFSPDNVQFTVYPNPASDKINIELKQAGKEKFVTLFGLMGNIVTSMKIPAELEEFSIPVAGLDTGLYFLGIQLNGEIIVRKVLVN